MPFINNSVLDNGLSSLSSASGTALHITATEQSTRANVLSNSLGNKATPTIGSPAARSPSGRQVTVSAITDGSVTATGTAGAWHIIDGSNILASGTLASSQAVTSGNTFTLGSFTIGIPGAA